MTITEISVDGRGLQAWFPSVALPVTLEKGDSLRLYLQQIPSELSTGIATVKVNTVGCRPAASLRVLYDSSGAGTRWLTLLYPDGGEVFTAGDAIRPEWVAAGAISSVTVQASLDSGRTWDTSPERYNSATGLLRLPFLASDSALARVRTSSIQRSRRILERVHAITSISIGLEGSALLMNELGSGKIELVDIQSTRVFATVENAGTLPLSPEMRFSPDATRISLLGDLHIWDLFAGQIVQNLDTFSIRKISDDWSTLFTWPYRHATLRHLPDTVTIRDFSSMRPIDTLTFPCGRRGVWSVDGDLIASVSCTEDSMRILRRSTGREVMVQLYRPEDPDGSPQAVRITPGSDSLLCITYHPDGQRLRIWETEQGGVLYEINLNEHFGAIVVRDADFTADGRIILFGHDELNVLDTRDTTMLTIEVPAGISSFDLSDNRRFVVTGNGDGSLWYHRLDTLPEFEDLSDRTWRIVMPKAETHDIYLGEVESGDYIRRPVNVIRNAGETGFSIDTAWFDPVASDPEFLAESYPSRRIMPGDSVPIGLYFRAGVLGRRTGLLVVEYQGGERLEVTVTADVIPSSLDVATGDTLRFPTVLRQHTHDSAFFFLRNVSDDLLTIDSVRLEGRDGDGWRVVDPGQSRLQPGESISPTLRFAPEGIGLHRGLLSYYFAHRHGGVHLPLQGGSLPEGVAVRDTILPYGTIFDVPVTLLLSHTDIREGLYADYQGRVSFDTTRLIPYAQGLPVEQSIPMAWDVEDGVASFPVAGSYRIDGGHVDTLRFLTRSETPGTPVRVEELVWSRGMEEWSLDTSVAGIVTITGSGPGLFTGDSTGEIWGIVAGYPNPADELVSFDLSLRGDESITLDLFNNSGRLIVRLWEGGMKEGIYHFTVDCSRLASGAYHVRAGNGEDVSTWEWVVVH